MFSNFLTLIFFAENTNTVMSAVHLDKLIRHRSELINNLNIALIIDPIISAKILCIREMNHIKAKMAREQKVSIFLDYLMLQPDQKYLDFLG